MAVIIALLISPIGAVFWLALGLTILYAVSQYDVLNTQA